MQDPSSNGKDRKLRLVMYMLKMTQKNLDKVVDKIKNGELIDTSAF